MLSYRNENETKVIFTYQDKDEFLLKKLKWNNKTYIDIPSIYIL